MTIDSHNFGWAVISRRMPRKSAIRMPSVNFKSGSRSRPIRSELIVFAVAQALRIAPMRLPVTTPGGTIRTKDAIATLSHAKPKLEI